MKKLCVAMCVAFIYMVSAPLFAFTGFSHTMGDSVRSVDKEVMEKLSKSPKTCLPLVVDQLVARSEGEFTAMVIHDWICDTIAYDTAAFTDSSIYGQQDYVTVLQKKKATSAGYANVMCEMCRLAGIDCIAISGQLKSGMEMNGTWTWNAVFEGNGWHLLDVALDAGFVDRGYFVKHYSADWIGLTAGQFVFSHLPDDESFQYLKKPVSKRVFAMQPNVPAKFFTMGLSFANPKNMPYSSNMINSSVSFDFKADDPSVIVYASLDTADMSDYGRTVQRACWTNRMDDSLTVHIDVPSQIYYKAGLYVRRKGELKDPLIISAYDWNAFVLPKAAELLQENKITKNEYDFLIASYRNVAANESFYFIEDVFAFERSLAVTKIFSLLGVNSTNYDEILSFYIKASDKYAGYGQGRMRFPAELYYYPESMNIKLVAPMTGYVRKGGVQKFVVEAKGYQDILLVCGDSIWKPFAYDAKTKCYELKMEIPRDAPSAAIVGVRDSEHFEELIRFDVQ